LNNMRTNLESISSISLADLAVVESVSKCLTPTLESLRGRRIIFSGDDRELAPYSGWGLGGDQQHGTVTTFRPDVEKVLVAAVDSSSIKLAESEDGSLYAVKCGIATAVGGHALMHFKIGPVLFYLTEESVAESELETRLVKVVMFDDEIAKRLVRIRAERAVQMELASHLLGATILVDGSLRSSVFEDRQRSIGRITEQCALRRNTVVGISKSTRLKPLERAAAPLAKVSGPAYLEVDAIVKSMIRSSVGSSVMIKLDCSGPVMRADILGGNVQDSLGKLIANDAVSGGYPETLRLAHHISTFSGTEVTCLRSHVLNNYEVTELVAEDVRRTLLGSISV
jgi:hypothetical protein